MRDRTEGMADLRRAVSVQKTNQVRAALAGIVESGQPITKSGVARAAGVSRSFMRNEQVAELVDQAIEAQSQSLIGSAKSTGRVAAASLVAELENAKARNKRQQDEISRLRRKLSQVLGQEIAQELGLPTTSHGDDLSLAEQLEIAHREKLELEEQLRLRSEELEAAQSINREMFAELNRLRSSNE